MAIPLLTLPLKQKRDMLRARQLIRHAVHLLGFDAADQISLTAAVFDLACQAFTPTGRANLCCAIDDDCLRVTCTPVAKSRRKRTAENGAVHHLTKCLPAAAVVARADVPWMLEQLAVLAPLDLFDEMRKLNQDLLAVLLDRVPHKAVITAHADPSAA